MKRTFTGLDYWRLADEISVVDASFLSIGLDPGSFKLMSPENPSESEIVQVAGWSDAQIERAGELDDGSPLVDPSQFRAVFKAIRNAVIGNKIKARIVNWARHPDFAYFGGETHMAHHDQDEEARSYGFALSRGMPTLYSNSDSITDLSKAPHDRVLYVLKEPNWTMTTIETEELKQWFIGRGFAPMFFFPDAISEGFRDKAHPRYSSKLAAAVAAWETVRRAARNKSVKQSLADWLTSNGVSYGLGNADGVVTPTVADEVAKIANWQTSGGATPTYAEYDDVEDMEERDVQNFEKVTDPNAEPFYDGSEDMDPDIPF